MTNLRLMVQVMMLGEVWTAWSLYGFAVLLGGLLPAIQDRHARSWYGFIAMFIFVIATVLFWHYMSDGRTRALEEIIKAAYMHPEMYGARP